MWLHVYLRSSSGGDDTTAVTWSPFTTDADSYILIEQYDFPTDGKWDDTKYQFHNNDSSIPGMACQELYLRINKLQVKVTETSTNTRNGITLSGIAASANDIRINNVLFKGVVSGTGAASGLNINDGDAGNTTAVRVWNCIAYDIYISADTDFKGFGIPASTAVKLNNCTAYNCTEGFYRNGGTVDVYNCISASNDDDFWVFSIRMITLPTTTMTVLTVSML